MLSLAAFDIVCVPLLRYAKRERGLGQKERERETDKGDIIVSIVDRVFTEYNLSQICRLTYSGELILYPVNSKIYSFNKLAQ